MASPRAYEQPTLNKAWDSFVAHIPTIFLIWIASAVLAGIGFGVYMIFMIAGFGVSSDSADAAITAGYLLGQIGQLPFSILSSLVGILFIAVPAMYYETGEVITINAAFSALLKRPFRYLLAGLLFSLVAAIGFLLCILPGIAVALVMPVYVNRIFLTDEPVFNAFSRSFQAVYRSPNGLTFVGIELLAWLMVVVVSVCTCGLGALLAVPVSTFYLQNSAYHQGLIS